MYYELTINAAEPETEIWLIDENGHPVQKGIGTLSTHVLGGTYFIAFGLKARRCCSISLDTSVLTSQAELEASGTCPRPTVRFPGDEGYVEYHFT